MHGAGAPWCAQRRCCVCLLYWYNSTNTGTTVHILTLALARPGAQRRFCGCLLYWCY
jgi:hypothetical protein